MDKKQLQQRVTEQRRRVRRRLTIRGVLSLLVVLTFIRCAFMQRYENMFVCVLSLVLLAMPTLIEKQLAIDIPPMMEAIILSLIHISYTTANGISITCSAADALLQFAAESGETGKIESMTAGYRMQTDSSRRIRLTPTWKIDTETGEYLVDRCV